MSASERLCPLSIEQLNELLNEHWNYQGVPAVAHILDAMRSAIDAALLQPSLPLPGTTEFGSRVNELRGEAGLYRKKVGSFERDCFMISGFLDPFSSTRGS